MSISIDQILSHKTASILLTEERKRKDIAVGAPHHSPGGVEKLPCYEHPDADENTGFIAWQIAERLDLSSVIACNYRIDPNKNLRTDYSMQIAQWSPKYLIEIHGHGGKKVSDTHIEISSGSLERGSFSKKFSERLQQKFQNHHHLNTFKVSGDFAKLHFQATKSATIVDDRWIPIHIELPPALRLDKNKGLPSVSSDLISFLTETITEICI